MRGARALIFSSFTSGCGIWYPAKMTLSSECSCLRAKRAQPQIRATTQAGAQRYGHAKAAARARCPHILIKFPSVWSSRCTVKVPALATFVSATKDTLRCPSGTMKRSYNVGAFIVPS